MTKTKVMNWLQKNTMTLILVLVFAFFAWRTEGKILMPNNISNLIAQNAYVFILATGMLLCILTTGMLLCILTGGNIDLSVGSMLAMTGVLSILGMNLLPPGMEQLGVWAALGIALASGAVAGAVNGLLVSLGKIPPFIATLGTLSIFRSLALYFADAGLVLSKNSCYREVGSFVFLGVPLPTLVLICLTVILGGMLRNTRFVF